MADPTEAADSTQEAEEATHTDATEATGSFKLLPPKWQAIVEMVRRFTADSENAQAASGLLDELNRLAIIADGDHPSIVLSRRPDAIPDATVS